MREMLTSMAGRVIWAVLTATLLGVWLFARSSAASGPSNRPVERITRLLRISVLGMSAFWAAMWVVIAFSRVSYPYELEWMGGSVRDGCERVLSGQSLYTPPGPDWIPFLYPPLYFWVSAGMMHLAGGVSFAAMRLVSIFSTLGSAALIYLCVRRLIGPNRLGSRWGLIAAGLFLAEYRIAGAWYDIERVDMLFIFLTLMGMTFLMPRGNAERPADSEASTYGEADPTRLTKRICFSPGGAAAAAICFSLASLTKQHGLLFLAAGATTLAFARDWRSLGSFSVVAFTISGGMVALLNRQTGGWFGYYVFQVPAAGHILPELVTQFLIRDLPLMAPMLAIMAVSRLVNMRSKRERNKTSVNYSGPDPRDLVLAAMTAFAILASFLGRVHWGGFDNVLIPGLLFVGMPACVAAGRLELRRPMASLPLYALCLAQIAAFSYNPAKQLPNVRQREAGARAHDAIRELEREGEVLYIDHGAITASRHFHLMALSDVYLTEKRLPEPILEALANHRFAVVVMDAPMEEKGELCQVLAREYPAIVRLDISAPWVLTGFETPNTERPMIARRTRNPARR